MEKADYKVFRGIIAIGLVLAWNGYIPFYGPLLAEIGIFSYVVPDLYVLGHIMGLMGGAYYYARYNEKKVIHQSNIFLSLFLAGLTLSLFPLSNHPDRPIVSIVFILMGLFTGWLVSRWMAWFSSAPTLGKRGFILGFASGGSALLISSVALSQQLLASNISWLLLVSSVGLAVGGLIITALPLEHKKYNSLFTSKLKTALPPLHLIIFALTGYSAVAISHRLVLSQGLKEPIMPWLLVIPYIVIGLYLGARSDKWGRNILFILAFLCSGFGFLFLVMVDGYHHLNLIFGLLVNSGLLLLRLFFWLSLVDYQRQTHAPMALAIGVSIEMAVYGLSYSISSVFIPAPDSAKAILGLSSAALILVGLAFAAFFSSRPGMGQDIIKDIELPISKYLTMKIDPENSLIFMTNSLSTISQVDFEKKLTAGYKLTKREIGIAYLIANGYQNKEICQICHITVNTLKYHLRNIYTKISVTNRYQAIEKLFSLFFKDN